jgi:hypothetical protein
MSQSSFGFAEASVQKLPSLACIGYVDVVADGKVSESGKYIVQGITLRGFGPSRGCSTNLLYRPEWISATFNPDSLNEFGDEGQKMLAVYRRNIAVRDGISALKGLAGSEERYQALAQKLLTLPAVTEATVSDVLKEFFSGDQFEIGYVLRQRKNKTGETDENGKDVYELTNGYEVQEYFFVTKANIEKLQKRAARSKDGMFKVAFEVE